MTAIKTIGLLGGMSWESSIEYERIINTEVRRRLGGTSSADLLIRSYNFAEIEEGQMAGAWEDLGRLLATDAVKLQDAGAEVIVLCTNTMHKVAAHIEAAISAEFIHLGDTTADAVKAAGVERVALLGTRYTMEQAFYRDRLVDHGLDVLVPDEPDRTTVHDIIFEELVKGVVSPKSKALYLDAIQRLTDRGAMGVIAGCTEIELLITEDDVTMPYFPTAKLHALAAVDAALSKQHEDPRNQSNPGAVHEQRRGGECDDAGTTRPSDQSGVPGSGPRDRARSDSSRLQRLD